MPSRRALLRHLWAMVQTRAEAATLVVKLQRTAVTQGLAMYAIAAMAAMSFMTALIVLIAVAVPPGWRVLALGIVTVALLATVIYAVVTASRRLTHDANLIADFTRGLKLDLAMINLALKDADVDDEEESAKREHAKEAVRKAAADKAATPSTAEDSRAPSAGGPAANAAAAAMQAAAPSETDKPMKRDTAPVKGGAARTRPQAAGAVQPPVSARSSERFANASIDAQSRAPAADRAAGGTFASTSAVDASRPVVTERERLDPLTAQEGMTPIPSTTNTDREAAGHGRP
jgi:uncharacterized membrane protein YqjE